MDFRGLLQYKLLRHSDRHVATSFGWAPILIDLLPAKSVSVAYRTPSVRFSASFDWTVDILLLFQIADPDSDLIKFALKFPAPG